MQQILVFGDLRATGQIDVSQVRAQPKQTTDVPQPNTIAQPDVRQCGANDGDHAAERRIVEARATVCQTSIIRNVNLIDQVIGNIAREMKEDA